MNSPEALLVSYSAIQFSNESTFSAAKLVFPRHQPIYSAL